MTDVEKGLEVTTVTGLEAVCPNIVGTAQAFRVVAQLSFEACQSAFPVTPVSFAFAPLFRNEIER